MKCHNCKIELLELDHGKPTYRLECMICGYNMPLAGKNTKVINEFYTWLSVDTEGKEGIIAVLGANNVFQVAQHSERAMALRLKPMVMNAAKDRQMKVKLVQYVRLNTIDEG